MDTKILFLDVETALRKVLTFDMFQHKGMIPFDNMEQDTFIITASWKWKGKKVQSASVDQPGWDSYVLEELGDAIMEADVLVYHNGDKFDRRVINSRRLLNGMEPLPRVASVDTLKIARGEFMLASNRLDALGELLGVGRKMSTGGLQLWRDCLSYNDDLRYKAIARMSRYCKRDVLLLEKVFNVLEPFRKSGPLLSHKAGSCPSCGYNKLQARGRRLTAAGWRQRYQCNNCGRWMTSNHTQVDNKMRLN